MKKIKKDSGEIPIINCMLFEVNYGREKNI